MSGPGVWARVSALLDLGRSREAQAELGRALASTPDDAGLWRVLSHVQGSLGEHGEALVSARRAAALEPGSSEAQSTLGVALWNAQVLGQPAGWIRLSRLRRQGGVAAPALAAMHRALHLDPHDADTHTTLGGMYLSLNDLKRGETHLRAALGEEPHLGSAHLGLAHLALKRSQAAQAEEHARNVLAQDPQSVRALELLARAQLRQRQPDQAFRSALAAVKLDPASDYAQAQFRALHDGYLPQPAAQTLLFDAAMTSVRNAYRRTRLSPEVRMQLRQVQRPELPLVRRPLPRLLIIGVVAALVLLSLRVPHQTLQRIELTFFGALYAGIAVWIITLVIRRRRSRS